MRTFVVNGMKFTDMGKPLPVSDADRIRTHWSLLNSLGALVAVTATAYFDVTLWSLIVALEMQAQERGFSIMEAPHA